jgi:hypothetical protein
MTKCEQMIYVNEDNDISSLLTNIVHSLHEFISTINIVDECQLTSDAYIQHRKTGKCYLLTQAMELGLISFTDNSEITQSDHFGNILHATFAI